MPMFSYRALDSEGRQQQGEVDASDRDNAVQQLQRRGLLILQLKQGNGLLRSGKARSVFKPVELITLTQQLTTLISAGQPLDKALGTVLKNIRRPAARAVLERVRDQVKAGLPLSQALEEHPASFSPFYTSLVRAGEAGGVLETTLAQLSGYLEQSHKLRGEVINALIYPAFLVIGVIGSLALLLAYVVPQFVPIFQDLGVPIPLVTRAVLVMGEFVNVWGLICLLTLAAATWLGLAARRDPARRIAQDRRLWCNRLFGPLLQRLETARLARTLGTLLCNSVSLLGALAIGREVSANHALRQHVANATEQVRQGSSLTQALNTEALLPELALQMIEVGEQSATLGTLLLKVADVYDLEAKRTIDRLLAALVPTLTIVMAVMVAAIMLAIMLPLMSLTSNI
ncbi:type II secretion system protein GspF [Pseudomonas sp. BN505]|uniref:type II secretion system F family protein n=1 Tax=unclassified Pseudomonas TaxID=196821 RepID=UPI002458C490|nr:MULTISPECIES: type II secretion system F family protein [unclassified Pseudomonas]MDH4846022.1 type II secretion system protein GspF [Pseudomonas sp. BN605]MDH4858131.1 type II secretion system protein GspF [Pseudomonas sp. BN505]